MISALMVAVNLSAVNSSVRSSEPLHTTTSNDEPPTTILSNNVTIYGGAGSEPVQQLSDVINAYPTLWVDHGNVVDVPESCWMPIPIIDDWQAKYTCKAKVYPLGRMDKQVVDEEFNRLHQEGKMDWSGPTPFSYPCFVVWRTMPDGSREGRVVVDIRSLNQITVPDVYPMPLQSDIIAAVQGSTFITTVDCASFFHQWRVRREDQHRLAVISHRGQETFKVAVMGYRNSPSYVQRMIDNILRPFPYSRAYVDDIVIFSKSLTDHIKHLHMIFRRLTELNVALKPTKSFIGYPSVQLLGQRVNAFGLSTAIEKLQAIAQIEFPTTLKLLETYLGMTSYLRQYIPFFAQVSGPLQDRKKFLLKGIPSSGRSRKVGAAKTTILDPTSAELASFHALQNLFARPTMLTHYSHLRQLFADLEASQRGIGAMVYHVKGDSTAKPQRGDVEPVLFLSRVLNTAEKGYWPTELEVAGLVWTIMKIRHLIESSEHPIIIYTDHGASLGLAKQSTISPASTDRQNKRLIRASEYVQRFRIEIRHKEGRTNYVPDALSRLRNSLPDPHNAKEDGILDTFFGETYVYSTTLIEMSDAFKSRLLAGYTSDKRWDRVLKTLQANDQLEKENRAALPFELGDGLIYHVNSDGVRRLCIPEHDSLIHDILQLGHDEIGHPGFHRTYERISQSLYIRKLYTTLREFIRQASIGQ